LLEGKGDLANANPANFANFGRGQAPTLALANPEKAESAPALDAAQNHVEDARDMVEQGEEEEQAAPPQTEGESPTLLEDRASLLPGEKPCMVCRHSRRPGTKVHCREEARPDLPPAYSENHPLRLLPDDMGASCKAFHPEWRPE
jgi:hypothetical protein